MAKPHPKPIVEESTVHALVVLGPASHGEVTWASVDASGHARDHGSATIPTIAAHLKPTKRLVLFDASLTTPLQLDLPNMPKHRQAQALKWAAEEYVAGPIEEEHVVAGPRDGKGRLLAVTLTQASMDMLVTQTNALAPDQMMPDALCLPHVDGQLSMAKAGDDVLMRWGEWAFGRFHEDIAWSMLDAFDALDWVWFGDMPPPDPVAGRVSRSLEDQPLVAVLAKQALTTPINVLTGPWQPKSALELKGQWAWVLGLIGACLLLVLAQLGIEQRMLKRDAERLRAEVATQFQALFPDQPAIGRERELASRELERLQFGQSAGLMALMARVGPTIAGQTHLSLQSLDYREGQLTLGVQGPDVASIDQLGRQLTQGGLSANVRSATLSSDGARAEITVTGRAL